MRNITVADVRRLLEPQQPPCISIYMSTDPRWPGGPTDRLRMKGLLRKAAERAAEKHPRRTVSRLMRSVTRDVEAAWPPRDRTIAILRSPEVSLTAALPMDGPSVAVVAPTFHTRPLVSLLDRERRFFVLALSERLVRLFEGDPSSLAEVTPEVLPTTLREALGEPRLADPLVEVHGGGPGPGQGVHRGGRQEQGRGRRARLRRWFRAVDGALWDHLRGRGTPLLLAGPAVHHALYRSVSRYPWLLETGLELDVGGLSPAELHARAWPIVSAHQALREERAAEEWRARAGTGLARDHVEDVARAASEGRVRTLLHRQGALVWGRVDPGTGEVELREAGPQAGDADVLDDLCELVLRAGGDVLEVAPERMPTGSPVAALLRA